MADIIDIALIDNDSENPPVSPYHVSGPHPSKREIKRVMRKFDIAATEYVKKQACFLWVHCG